MRTPSLRTTALLAAAGVSVAVVGTAHGAATTTTPTTTAAAATTAAAPTTAAGVTTAVAPTTAAATTTPGTPTTAAAASTVAGATTVPAAATVLPPNATLEQLSAALAGVFGPTTDLAAELAPFVTLPAGIPTPGGAVVEEASFYFYPDAESAKSSYFRTTILVTSSVPAAELVTLYQTQMPAAGFVQTGDAVENEDTRQVRFLQYDVAAPTTDYDEVSIGIVDETSSLSTDFVQLEVTSAYDPAQIQAYAGWTAGMPMIEGLPLQDASVSTFNFGGDISMSLSNTYTVELPLTEAQTQLAAGLAGSPYTLDPESNLEEDGYATLVNPQFDDVTVYLNEGYPEGTTSFRVSASLDLVV